MWFGCWWRKFFTRGEERYLIGIADARSRMEAGQNPRVLWVDWKEVILTLAKGELTSRIMQQLSALYRKYETCVTLILCYAVIGIKLLTNMPLKHWDLFVKIGFSFAPSLVTMAYCFLRSCSRLQLTI
jgi:hypothetical protein